MTEICTSSEGRPKLRDCPFRRTKGSDDENLHFVENHVVCNGDSYVSSYSIFCTGCGVELHDEYRGDLVRRWNGEKETPYAQG